MGKIKILHQKNFVYQNLSEKRFWVKNCYFKKILDRKIFLEEKSFGGIFFFGHHRVNIGGSVTPIPPQENNGVNCLHYLVLSKPNATQLNSTLKQLALELDTVVTCSTHHPTTNFSATSRPARELKFGTDTH